MSPHGLQSLLTPDHGVELGQAQDQIEPILAQLFAFAYIWGLGGSLTHECHQPFTAFVRTQLAPLVLLAQNSSAFDFFVDVKQNSQGMVADVQQWGAVLPAFAYDKRMPYFQMLVPTVDTVRYSFLLRVSCLTRSPADHQPSSVPAVLLLPYTFTLPVCKLCLLERQGLNWGCSHLLL